MQESGKVTRANAPNDTEVNWLTIGSRRTDTGRPGLPCGPDGSQSARYWTSRSNGVKPACS
jgi:hypothetical protein